MAFTSRLTKSIPINRLFLSLVNPRFKPVESEEKAIERLCSAEYVYPLARDIAKHGLNPLEQFALIPLASSEKNSQTQNFFVAEGNRRVCAIKLLNDPDLAPANLRGNFEKVAQTWAPIKVVNGVIFDSIEEVDIWLNRIHKGLQGGIGRKDWNPDQQARHDGSANKNKPALALLDYAVREGLISEEDRSGRLTTVQRFLTNDVFKEFLGLDTSNPEEIARNRPKKDFDAALKVFIKDLIDKSANSRMNRQEIVDYTRPLNNIPGRSSARVQSEPLTADPPAKSDEGKKKSVSHPKPDRVRFIQHETEISSALKNFNNEKLISLYYSITSVSLEAHTPLVAVGVWSFFETLTSCAGRSGSTSLDSFLSKSRLSTYGLSTDAGSLRGPLERIRDYGNTTKHHRIAATFNGDQLNNDVVALKEVILKCLADAASQP